MQEDDGQQHAEDHGGLAQGRHQGDGGQGHGPEGDAVGAQTAQAAEQARGRALPQIADVGAAVPPEHIGMDGEDIEEEDPAGVADAVAAGTGAVAIGQRIARDDQGGAQTDEANTCFLPTS